MKNSNISTSFQESKERECRVCHTIFIRKDGENNKWHCSEECAIESARSSRRKFHKLNPHKYVEYNKRWHKKVGTDGNMLRFRLRYPNAPKKCQSCGEDRVLDIAHRHGHERRGAWRSVKNTTIDKVWILCPTCHALYDRKGYTEKQLGLV